MKQQTSKTKKEHVTKLRIKQQNGEHVDLPSSDNFMWRDTQSEQLTVHLNNLIASYGRDQVKGFIVECIYPELNNKANAKRKKAA